MQSRERIVFWPLVKQVKYFCFIPAAFHANEAMWQLSRGHMYYCFTPKRTIKHLFQPLEPHFTKCFDNLYKHQCVNKQFHSSHCHYIYTYFRVDPEIASSPKIGYDTPRVHLMGCVFLKLVSFKIPTTHRIRFIKIVRARGLQC